MILEGKVGPVRRDFGDQSELRTGYEGQLITNNLHGRFFEAALNGNMFVAQAATAGIALIVAATGSPIITFTHVAPTNVHRGSDKVSKAKWAPATCTFAVAPGFLMGAGISMNTMAAASTNAPFALKRDYEGGFLVGPGVAISLCTQAATTTALMGVNIHYIETKIPNLPN